MTKVYNTPTVQYLIEVRLPISREVVDRFVIEQNEGSSRDAKRERGCYNTVQAHLSCMSSKSGLDYEIVGWGDIKDRTEWIQGGPLEG